MGVLPDLSKYEKYQELTQGTMRYYEAGTHNKRKLLLCHGMGVYTTADTFLFMIEPLAEKYHVIAVDYLGFGKSTRKLANGPTFDVIVDGIRELLYKLDYHPVDLIGHSAGPWFGGILAYESPNLVRSLIGIGPAGMNVQAVAGVANYKAPDRDNIRNNYIGNSVFEGSELTWEQVDAMADLWMEHGTRPSAPEAFEALKPLVDQMATPDIRKSYLLQRRMPYLAMPTCWIWGKSEGMEPWPTYTAEWDQIGGDPRKSSKPWVPPQAEYHLLPVGTHNAHWELPTEVTRICSEFIDSVPE
jgi:pimeloyl-ACP methyl ester carboxylesterase